MTLEIIKRHPTRAKRAAPLFFIHGAYVGAWCWDEHFLSYFAGAGYEAQALSVRGHGRTPPGRPMDFLGIDDYVSDTLAAAENLEAPPVVIGHSMGANIAQRAARRMKARALVLLAPVPPQGLALSGWSLAARDPSLFGALTAMQFGNTRASGLGRVRDYLFSKSVTEHDALRYLLRMRRESQRALIDLTWPQHVWLVPSLGLPVLVVGAGNDAFFPVPMTYEAAAFHGTTPAIFPEMAHAMMLEPGWRSVADHILEWLERQGLGTA